MKQLIKNFLIYLVIVALLMPASLFLMIVSASPAQAADRLTAEEKRALIVDQSASKTKIAEEPVLMPEIKAIKGLKANYEIGENIFATVVFTGKVFKAWAKIDALDPSFSEILTLRSQGNGGWQLATPKLTPNLNLGDQIISLAAESPEGVSFFEIPVGLVKKEIKLSSKKIIGEEQIFLAFNPVKGATKYLASWNVQEESRFYLQVLEENQLLIENLQPGTVYELEISAIGEEGELGLPEKFVFRTLGEAPVREIAGVTKKEVTPAIGGGVSTSQVAQRPTEEVTPTPEESPKEEESEPAGGWSRVLVALAILIIAAGAAIGGYYGYEWYAGRARDNEPPEAKSSSRW